MRVLTFLISVCLSAHSVAAGFMRVCHSERREHPVRTRTFKNHDGSWIVYSQLIEVRNVGNRCNRNEYIYLAHQQKQGWLWNEKRQSLVHYSLDAPKFATVQIRDPDQPYMLLDVHMSRMHQAPHTNVKRSFTDKVATRIAAVKGSGLKWANTAKQLLPLMRQKTVYFQVIRHVANRHREDFFNREFDKHQIDQIDLY